MLRKTLQCLRRTIDPNLVVMRSLSTTTTICAKKKDNPVEEKEEEKEHHVIVDKDKQITMIGINRPASRNAINAECAAQLCNAFSAFEDDSTSSIAVLYGVGGSFCAGYDIFELDDDGQVSVDILMTQEGSVGPTRRRLQKPVICAINGYCVANGLELALMCDLRVMEESAILGFFNRRFGVPVIDGGTARLPAMIGISRSLDLILTGRKLDAVEALQMGIANRVVPTGSALYKAQELAFALSKFPQAALNHDRNSIYSAVYDGIPFNQAVQNEIMYTSKKMIEEMNEGITWFIKTFEASGTTHSWFQRERSMADWDDDDVAVAAAKVEEKKQDQEMAKIEAVKKDKEKKEANKANTKAKA